MNEWRQANTALFGKGNIDGMAMLWDTTDFCMKLLNAEGTVNQQEGEEFKCYMICDKQWWLCCTQTGSWGQTGMETQRKDVKNLLYSRRLLITPRMYLLQLTMHENTRKSWQQYEMHTHRWPSAHIPASAVHCPGWSSVLCRSDSTPSPPVHSATSAL